MLDSYVFERHEERHDKRMSFVYQTGPSVCMLTIHKPPLVQHSESEIQTRGSRLENKPILLYNVTLLFKDYKDKM